MLQRSAEVTTSRFCYNLRLELEFPVEGATNRINNKMVSTHINLILIPVEGATNNKERYG